MPAQHVPLTELERDLPAPAVGWAAELGRRGVAVVLDDLGRAAVDRATARALFAERREQEEAASRRREELERRVVAADTDVDVRFVLPGIRGQARLLAGMVRANRPWRLITGLSGALAAALAAGAFAVVTSDIWRLADSLGPLRLSVATVFSIGAMVAWLVIDHELWERPGGRVARDRARLFNTATVLTVVAEPTVPGEFFAQKDGVTYTVTAQNLVIKTPEWTRTEPVLQFGTQPLLAVEMPTTPR